MNVGTQFSVGAASFVAAMGYERGRDGEVSDCPSRRELRDARDMVSAESKRKGRDVLSLSLGTKGQHKAENGHQGRGKVLGKWAPSSDLGMD